MKRLKRLAAMLLILCLLASMLPTVTFAASTASGTCGDNLTWTLDDSYTLTISGTGAMDNWSTSSDVPWSSNRRSIYYVVIENDVTSIGNYAFSQCLDLRSVTIGKGVTSIGKRAFDSCISLSSVTIPNGVVTIGEDAFVQCQSLFAVSIPASVTSIGDGAFSYCWNSLGFGVSADNPAYSSDDSHVLFNKDKTELIQAPYCLSGEYTVPESVITICDEAFYSCEDLTSITIPVSVTSIGDLAFYGCYNLTDVYYNGTDTQWAKISIGRVNTELTDANIHTVEPTVTNITIRNQPDKVVYWLGETLDTTGLVLTVTYNDGNTETVTEGFIVSGFDSATAGNQTITVTYEGKSATFFITVKALLSSGTCGANLTWTVDNEGTLTISGTGNMSGWSILSNAPWYSYRTSIKTVVIETGVTSICNYAFEDCTSLTSVAIPDGVTSIGSYAFEFCESLTSITLPNSVKSIGRYAFVSSALTSITIPDSVTSIGDFVFYSCDSLMSITIPDSVTSIGNYAFYSCDSLMSITIPDSVTSIGNYAFYSCDSLTSITIPDSVTSIGYNAFFYCTNLTNLTIGNSVTSIGSDAFNCCRSLTSITIPDSVTSIGYNAFCDCDGLTDITIPSSVTSIGSSAFSSCNSLIGIWVDENNPAYSSDSAGVLFNKDKTILVQVPYGLSDNYAIPAGVTSIGNSAFYGCRSLTSITIPAGVTSIGNSAFYFCPSLTSITIPASMTSIGNSAFSLCDSLTDVYYNSTAAQWAKITIGTDNAKLTSANIIFTCEHTIVAGGVCTECGKTIEAVVTDSAGNVVGNFTAFNEAIKAAASGNTVTLWADTTEADLVLQSGITLDLNGYILTVDSVLTYSNSAIIDSSEQDTGVLKINDADGNMISQSNSQLPVYDAQMGGYRFFSVTVTSQAVTGNNKYWFKVEAENSQQLNALIQSGSAVIIKVKMTWDGQTEDTYATADLAFTQSWAEHYSTNGNTYITVTATENEGIENFTLTPIITSGGVEITGTEM